MPQSLDNLSVTWTGTTVYTGIKFSALDSGSGASLLMDLRAGAAGTTSVFSVDKNGLAQSMLNTGAGFRTNLSSGIGFEARWGTSFVIANIASTDGSGRITVSSDGAFQFASSTLSVSSPDVFLRRDAANTLAQRNGTNNQAFRLYGSYTDASNYERLALYYSGSTAYIETQKAGTGSWQSLHLGSVSGGSITIGANITLTASGSVSIASGNQFGFGIDVFLQRDAAQTLAQRNGTNAQVFRVYNTTDAGLTNYERGKIEWASNVLRIGTEKAGTGTARALELQTDGTTRVTIPTSGNITSTFPIYVNAGTERTSLGIRVGLTSGAPVVWSSGGDPTILFDTGLERASAGVVRVNNGSTGGGALQLTEMTAPAAPATDNVRIYAEDNGSGKTRLMALFPTGAAVQIAIEP